MNNLSLHNTIVNNPNYYSFGMLMPERFSSSSNYRYGFGGHEKDDEVSGKGNYLAFGDYGYNPRLARRFQIDPMIGTFPWMSPYAVFKNNPIYFADPTGLKPDGPGDPPDDGTANAGDEKDGYVYQCSSSNSAYDGWVKPSSTSSSVSQYEMSFDTDYTMFGGYKVNETSYNLKYYEVIEDGKSSNVVKYDLTYEKMISPWVTYPNQTTTFYGFKEDLTQIHQYSILFVNKENNSEWFKGNKAMWNNTLFTLGSSPAMIAYGRLMNMGSSRFALYKNRKPFGKWDSMSETERARFNHAISNHGQEFGLRWGKDSQMPVVVEQFNVKAMAIRQNGRFMGGEKVKFALKGQGQSTKMVNANVYNYTIGGQTWYYWETLNGTFISSGLKTR